MLSVYFHPSIHVYVTIQSRKNTDYDCFAIDLIDRYPKKIIANHTENSLQKLIGHKYTLETYYLLVPTVVKSQCNTTSVY